MLVSIHFLPPKKSLFFPPTLGDPAVGKTSAINEMLERLEGPGALDVKYSSILGEVLLYSEIKKSRLYVETPNLICLVKKKFALI